MQKVVLGCFWDSRSSLRPSFWVERGAPATAGSSVCCERRSAVQKKSVEGDGATVERVFDCAHTGTQALAQPRRALRAHRAHLQQCQQQQK